MNIELRLAQLSDLHVTRARGIPSPDETRHLLDGAIAQLHTLSRPDLDGVLITGDLVDCGLPAELDEVILQLNRLPVPWYAIPGNHDIAFPPDSAVLDRRRFYERIAAATPGGAAIYAGAAERGSWTALIKPGVRLVALDSNISGDWAGAVDTVQLTWLDETLAAAAEPLVVLMVHHPLHPVFGGWELPDFVGQDWEKFFCANGAEVQAILDRYPQVRIVLTGHTHISQAEVQAGRVLLSAPALGTYPLAYRLITLQSDDDGWICSWETRTPADADTIRRAQEELEGGVLGYSYNTTDPHQFSLISAGQPADQAGRHRLAPPVAAGGR